MTFGPRLMLSEPYYRSYIYFPFTRCAGVEVIPFESRRPEKYTRPQILRFQEVSSCSSSSAWQTLESFEFL
jgi:hypothetical protein